MFHVSLVLSFAFHLQEASSSGIHALVPGGGAAFGKTLTVDSADDHHLHKDQSSTAITPQTPKSLLTAAKSFPLSGASEEPRPSPKPSSKRRLHSGSSMRIRAPSFRRYLRHHHQDDSAPQGNKKDASDALPCQDISDTPPRQSPIPRPVRLGLRDCHTAQVTPPLTQVAKSSDVAANRPQSTYVEVHYSDSSNPCSTANLNEPSNNPSQPVVPPSQGDHPLPCSSSKLSAIVHNVPPTSSSENNILRLPSGGEAVVRPKHALMQQQSLHAASLLISGAIPKLKSYQLKVAAQQKESSESSESIDESMQTNCSNYLNLSDDEKLEKSLITSRLPRTDSEKLQQEMSDIKLLDAVDCDCNNIDSTVALLGPRNCNDGSIAGVSEVSTSNAGCCVPSRPNRSRNSSCKSKTSPDKQFACNSRADSSVHKVGDTNCKRTSSLHKSNSVHSDRKPSLRPNRLLSPSSPTRQIMKTPIARIESFHSDDFDAVESDEEVCANAPSPTSSSLSAPTPTIPCFAYMSSAAKRRSKAKKANKTTAQQNNIKPAKLSFAKDGIRTTIPDSSSLR